MKCEGCTKGSTLSPCCTGSIEPNTSSTNRVLYVFRPSPALEHLEIFFTLWLHPHQSLDRLARGRASRILDDCERHVRIWNNVDFCLCSHRDFRFEPSSVTLLKSEVKPQQLLRAYPRCTRGVITHPEKRAKCVRRGTMPPCSLAEELLACRQRILHQNPPKTVLKQPSCLQFLFAFVATAVMECN